MSWTQGDRAKAMEPFSYLACFQHLLWPGVDFGWLTSFPAPASNLLQVGEIWPTFVRNNSSVILQKG